MGSLGFYIKNRTLHCVGIKKTEEVGFCVTTKSKIIIDADPYEPSFLVQATNHIEKMCEEKKLNLNLCLRIDQCTTRICSFPFKEKFKIKRSLPLFLEEDIPLPPQQLLYEVYINPSTTEASKVLAIATESSQVLPLANSFHSDFRSLSSILFEATARANFLLVAKSSEHNQVLPPLAALFFTGDYVIFIYIEKGILARVHYFTDPSNQFLENIKVKTGLEKDFASKINFSKHSPHIQYIHSQFSKNFQTLKSQFQTLKKELPNFENCPIFFWGQFNKAPCFEEYLESQIEHKCFALESNAAFPTSNINSYEELVSAGTALESYKTNIQAPINFIPDSLRPNQIYLKDIFKKYKTTAFTTLIWLIFLFTYSILKNKIISENTSILKTTLEKNVKNIPYMEEGFTVDNYKKFITYKNKKDKAIQFLDKNTHKDQIAFLQLVNFKNLLDKKYLSEDLKITFFKSFEKGFSISGIIKPTLMSNFKNDLKNMGQVKPNSSHFLKPSNPDYKAFGFTVSQ